jgi:hypothetical protein
MIGTATEKRRPKRSKNSMSMPLTTEKRDELHRAVQVKGIRIAIFMLGYWGCTSFRANKAAELWPQYFHKAPFWAAVIAFLGFERIPRHRRLEVAVVARKPVGKRVGHMT